MCFDNQMLFSYFFSYKKGFSYYDMKCRRKVFAVCFPNL